MLPLEPFTSKLHCIQSLREMNSNVLMAVALKMLSALKCYILVNSE